MATNGVAQVKLQNELEDIQKDPPPFCTVALDGDDIFKWEVTINAPLKSIYEHGNFKVSLKFTENYPFSPPVVSF